MSDASSGASQARKLGLRAGQRVAVLGAPVGWQLTDPPDGLTSVVTGPADLILLFCSADAEISERLPGLAARVFPDGMIWVAWPRRAGGHRSDITDAGVRRHVLDAGLVDVKVATLDQDWSALKAVWRLADRSAPDAPVGSALIQ